MGADRNTAIQKLRRSLESLKKKKDQGLPGDARSSLGHSHRAGHAEPVTNENFTSPDGGRGGDAMGAPTMESMPSVGTWQRKYSEGEWFGALEDSGIDTNSAGKDDSRTNTTANSSRPVSSPTSNKSGRTDGVSGQAYDQGRHGTVREETRDKNSHSLPTAQDLAGHGAGVGGMLGNAAINRSCLSLQDYKPRRNLPKLSVSLEHLEQKKRSLSQILADKVQGYLNSRDHVKRREMEGALTPYMAALQSRRRRSTDVVEDGNTSVASLEVANILSESPVKEDYNDVYETNSNRTSISDACSYDARSKAQTPPVKHHAESVTKSSVTEVKDHDVTTDQCSRRHSIGGASDSVQSALEAVVGKRHGAWNIIAHTPPPQETIHSASDSRYFSQVYHGAHLSVPDLHNHPDAQRLPYTGQAQLAGSGQMAGSRRGQQLPAAPGGPPYRSSPRVQVATPTSPAFTLRQGSLQRRAQTTESLSLHTVIHTHDVLCATMFKPSLRQAYGIVVAAAEFPGNHALPGAQPPKKNISAPSPIRAVLGIVASVLELIPDSPAFICGQVAANDVLVEVRINQYSILYNH